jgi:hypothetical protein
VVDEADVGPRGRVRRSRGQLERPQVARPPTQPEELLLHREVAGVSGLFEAVTAKRQVEW